MTDGSNKKIKCDRCQRNLCLSCSSLNATELRVMQLAGKRCLRFICGACDETDNSAGGQNDIQQRMIQLESYLKSFYESSISSLRTHFSSVVGDLTEQIVLLRESNIQLIHFLNPGIGGSHPSESEELHTPSAGLGMSLAADVQRSGGGEFPVDHGLRHGAPAMIMMHWSSATSLSLMLSLN